MSSLVIFFTVTIAVIIPLNVVASKPPGDFNDRIRELLEQQIRQAIQNGKHQHLVPNISVPVSDSDSDSGSYYDSDFDSEDSNVTRYGRLGPGDILDLIGKAKRYKNKRRDEVTQKDRKDSYGNHIDGFERLQSKEKQFNILEQLLSRDVITVKPKRNAMGSRPKKRLEVNTLLPFKLNDDDGDNVSGLENYSKIFIMLDPAAISTNSGKNSLNDLVSEILSQNSASTDKVRQNKSRLPRYKGFLVKDDLWSRRARRESKEMYAPKEDEDEYKPKRGNRNDRGGGGGGGGGGRTAIPYIRHRGDIYERDN